MKLDVLERINLVSLLPAKGDYAALKTLRRAKEMLSFTPEELELYEIKTETGADGKPRTVWNGEKSAKHIKDVPVDEYTTNLIRNSLAEIDRKKELTPELMSLYEKFVVTYR